MRDDDTYLASAGWEPPDRWALQQGQTRAPRRDRVTHVVLVDGIPVDHWVEEEPYGPVDVASPWEQPGSGHRAYPPNVEPPPPGYAEELARLSRLVGGREALMSLGTEPLRQEDLDLTEIGVALAARVTDIVGQCDHVVDELLDLQTAVEMRTVVRRVITAVVRRDPGFLTRSARDDIAAAAVCWVAARANDLAGPGRTLCAQSLQERFGLRSSPVSRGHTAWLACRNLPPDAVDYASWDYASWDHASWDPASWDHASWDPAALLPTGLPGLLISSTRATIIARRDAALASAELD